MPLLLPGHRLAAVSGNVRPRCPDTRDGFRARLWRLWRKASPSAQRVIVGTFDNAAVELPVLHPGQHIRRGLPFDMVGQSRPALRCVHGDFRDANERKANEFVRVSFVRVFRFVPLCSCERTNFPRKLVRSGGSGAFIAWLRSTRHQTEDPRQTPRLRSMPFGKPCHRNRKRS